MENWKFLLLVIFLVSRCNTSPVNKTGLLFDELDKLIEKTAKEHVAIYAARRDCLKSSHALPEIYRSDRNGNKLLQSVIERYNLLTQMYNSGCKKLKNESLSGKDPTCGPFGCHKVEIRLPSDQPVLNHSKITQRTSKNINNIEIVLNVQMTEKPTQKPTEKPTKKPSEKRTENAAEEPKRNKVPILKRVLRWIPLPFGPFGYWE